MGAALLGFAMMLAGASAAADGKTEPGDVTYLVHYIDAQGLEWREAALADLKPISRQHGATVWIAPSGAMRRVLAAMQANPHTNILQAPKIIGRAGDVVHAHSRSDVSLATKVSFTGRSPHVELEKIRQGWMTTMVGRKLDQGILVRLVAENTVVLAVHHVAVKGGEAGPVHTARANFHSGVVKAHGTFEVIDGDFYLWTRGNDAPPCCAKDAVVAASATEVAEPPALRIDVPEVDTQEVAGEWLIGADEGLVVSFGVHTTADEHGKAVVRERLIVVRAHPTSPEEGSSKVATMAPVALPMSVPMAVARVPNAKVWSKAIRVAPMPLRPLPSEMAPPSIVEPEPIGALQPVFPAPVAPVPPVGLSIPATPNPTSYPAIPPPAPVGDSKLGPGRPPVKVHMAPLPAPATPSRSMPEGVDAEGNPAALPRLPEDDEPDVDASESSEPMPSPQTKKPKSPARVPASDTAAKRTGFVPPPVNLVGPLLNSLLSPVRFQFLIPLKPISLRLPFNQRLEFEIVGRVVGDSPILGAAAD